MRRSAGVPRVQHASRLNPDRTREDEMRQREGNRGGTMPNMPGFIHAVENKPVAPDDNMIMQ